MRLFGLIGYPLGHSFSKKYFTEKFKHEGIKDCQYELFPIENIDLLQKIIDKNQNLEGINCTIPYKQEVKNYLNEIDETAKKIGAVNTIKISRNNGKTSLKGYNTDCMGFEMALKKHLKPSHKKALVLGTGGSSKAVVFVLKKLGIDYKFVSRNKSDIAIDYTSLNKDTISEHKLIINTTPLGMHPDTNNKPDLPYDYITKNHYLFDLIYNPEETTFMREGKKNGAIVKNGLDMLYGQAEKAWEIWNK